MYKNPLIMITGILILLFSLGVDLIGLGDSSGIHWVQLSGALAGFSILCYGTYLHFFQGKPVTNRISLFIRKLFSWRNIGVFLTCSGLLIALLFTAVNLIGLGDQTGVNRTQVKGVLFGVALSILGLWMWRPDKGAPKFKQFRLLRFLLSRVGIGVILFAAGLVLILAAVGADLINQELEPGFGFIQVAVVILVY